jgi:hypothetical protein
MKNANVNLSKLEKRIEELEKSLNVNKIVIINGDNNIKTTGDDVIRIKLRWDDIPDEQFEKIEQKYNEQL